MKKLRDLFKSSYDRGWDDGFAIATTTTLRVVVNMLQKEQYKNKGADPYYDYALKAIIEKIEDINA